MAVVFISPKQRQKVFFLGITVAFLLFVAIVALIVFFSQPQPSQAPLAFNKPKVNIDFKIFDSEQFKNLEPFSEMELQFVYSASDKAGKPVEGLISEVSIEEAKNVLESMGLTVTNIDEVKIGRDNPFTPYSTVLPASGTKQTTTKK